MTTEEFKKILDKGETDTVEFKSWINTRNIKEIVSFTVDEFVLLLTAKVKTYIWELKINLLL